jgi:hypothetical protein
MKISGMSTKTFSALLSQRPSLTPGAGYIIIMKRGSRHPAGYGRDVIASAEMWSKIEDI